MRITVTGAGPHLAALAGLPEQFRPVDGPADVIAVGGEGWVEAAAEALAGGARGVFVARPTGGDPDAVRALDAGDTVVVIESPLLDPAWQAIRPALRDAVAGADLLDSVAVPGALLDQIALVRDAAGGFEPGGRVDTAGAYAVTGTAQGVPVTLAGTGHGLPELRFDLRAHTAHHSVRFDLAALAAPTYAARYDRDGTHQVPTSYETMHRAAWRYMAELRQPPFTLADLADVLSLASGGAAGGPPPSGAGRG